MLKSLDLCFDWTERISVFVIHDFETWQPPPRSSISVSPKAGCALLLLLFSPFQKFNPTAELQQSLGLQVTPLVTKPFPAVYPADEFELPAPHRWALFSISHTIMDFQLPSGKSLLILVILHSRSDSETRAHSKIDSGIQLPNCLPLSYLAKGQTRDNSQSVDQQNRAAIPSRPDTISK